MFWADKTTFLRCIHMRYNQVAVVAGLEALKDAGIVSGEGEAGWMLPSHMRDTTGVMYASSFPALDAAIGEVRESDCEVANALVVLVLLFYI